MTKIKYVKGDAREPIGDGHKIIIHCCNNIGAWGSGFVMSLSQKWGEPAKQYRRWYKKGKGFRLGNVQFVKVAEDIHVCNMIGQYGIKKRNGKPPIRYSAIERCLEKVAEGAKRNNASVHAPRFGADRARGNWQVIESIIQNKLCEQDIPVTVYTL